MLAVISSGDRVPIHARRQSPASWIARSRLRTDAPISPRQRSQSAGMCSEQPTPDESQVASGQIAPSSASRSRASYRLPLQISPKLDARVGDMGSDGGLEQFSRSATSSAGSPSTSRSSRAVRSRSVSAARPRSRCSSPLVAQQRLLRALTRHVGPSFHQPLRQPIGQRIDLAEVHLPVPPEKIDRRITGDSRQPVRGALGVFELVPVLQGLDKCFLRRSCASASVSDDAVNQQENPAQVIRDKPRLLLFGPGGGVTGKSCWRTRSSCSLQRPVAQRRAAIGAFTDWTTHDITTTH